VAYLSIAPITPIQSNVSTRTSIHPSVRSSFLNLTSCPARSSPILPFRVVRCEFRCLKVTQCVDFRFRNLDESESQVLLAPPSCSFTLPVVYQDVLYLFIMILFSYIAFSVHQFLYTCLYISSTISSHNVTVSLLLQSSSDHPNSGSCHGKWS